MKKLFICLLLLALTACGQEEWKESPTFTYEGQSMQGVENRVAFLTEDVTPIRAGETNKYLWHFWSDKEDYFGTFEVVATHEENGKTVHVYGAPNPNTAQPLNGANHHLLSLMSLPDPGIWRIDLTFGTVLFESVYIDVEV
ncbi:MAG: DUF4871 domain-containing protein [Lysinibacillus sp.]